MPVVILKRFLIAVLGLAALQAAVASGAANRVTGIRLWAGPEGTRLVLDLSAAPAQQVFTLESPDRIVIDLDHTSLAIPSSAIPAGQGSVKTIRTGPRADQGLRIVLDLAQPSVPRSFVVGPATGGDAALLSGSDSASGPSAGHRLVVELPATSTAAAPDAVATTGRASATVETARPATAPVKSLNTGGAGRDLVIAVDAGHGGKDPGALGRGGTREKDVTLSVARRLAQLIDAEDGLRAVLIRDGDHFVSLRGRIHKARERKADMFVSIHADSAPNREANGSSVYVLSLRGASDEAARWLAERENAADLVGGVSLDDKNDVLASVLLDVTQEENLNGSIEAARSVLGALGRNGELLRTRVQHAGFIVLKSPDIPSMLIETGFVSNASDERRLRDPAHQQQLAASIQRGILQYFHEHAPPGTRIANLAALGRARDADAVRRVSESAQGAGAR